MITYDKSPFGFNLLFRINGSAIYRATVPGALAVILYFMIGMYLNFDSDAEINADKEIRHPYALGILVGSISFLLVFRVQAAYARYWEAATAVHHMMSKWMDATMHTAVYHMQCSHYNHIKPPAFFDHHELNQHSLSRARESPDCNEIFGDDDRVKRAVSKSIERVSYSAQASVRTFKSTRQAEMHCEPLPKVLDGSPRLDGNWGNLFPDGKATFLDPQNPDRADKAGFAGTQGGRTPILFLQECAHLSSLMCGVALSTLRNDIDGAPSPLDLYEPGSPWPEVDHFKEVRKEGLTLSSLLTALWYFLGTARSPDERTRYNASRPLPVLGGVSEAEIRFLQMARGPYAKTQLCWAWFSEFMIREHLAGSLGNVGPPIISRIIQFLGDGMIYYNHARKIMFIPFPFPHAQLSAVFVMMTVPAVALLMDQYTNTTWLGAVLTFFTVTCLSGMQEVARELENPFRNVPNELPLVTFQAQYNEALIVMFSGYHPDLFFDNPLASSNLSKDTGRSDTTDTTHVSSNGDAKSKEN